LPRRHRRGKIIVVAQLQLIDGNAVVLVDHRHRAQLQQRYPDVFGNGGSPWKVSVTPATKNIDGSTSMGSVIRYNDQTGQVEEVKLNGAAQPQAAPQEASKRVVRQTYTTPNGQVMTWTEKGWVPA